MSFTIISNLKLEGVNSKYPTKFCGRSANQDHKFIYHHENIRDWERVTFKNVKIGKILFRKLFCEDGISSNVSSGYILFKELWNKIDTNCVNRLTLHYCNLHQGITMMIATATSSMVSKTLHYLQWLMAWRHYYLAHTT